MPSHRCCRGRLFGHSPRAPYDRIMATRESLLIPSAWIGQARPGGLILAIVAGAKVLLAVGEDGSASGRFRPDGVRFMPVRGHGAGAPPLSGADPLGDGGATRTVTESFLDEEDDSDYWFLFELLVAPQAMGPRWRFAAARAAR